MGTTFKLCNHLISNSLRYLSCSVVVLSSIFPLKRKIFLGRVWLERCLFLVEVHQLIHSLPGFLKHRIGTECTVQMATRTPPWLAQEETFWYQPYPVALKIFWMNNGSVYCQSFIMCRRMTATRKITKVAPVLVESAPYCSVLINKTVKFWWLYNNQNDCEQI